MRVANAALRLMFVSAAVSILGGVQGLQAQEQPAADGTASGSKPPVTASVAEGSPAGGSANVSQTAPPKKTFLVPAGTKVLLQLRSSVNTKSAKPGDGVYLSSAFPVVVGNRVLIPSGVFVQGIVDRVVRAGHLKGKAQLDMHFTSMIFPNGSVIEIPGVVSGLPGASKQDVKNGEGTIEQDKNKSRNAAKTAEIALPTGGTVGTVAGLGTDHPVAGGFAGLGAGLAAVGLVTLFTRGADVDIQSGTQVEMVFQRPLILEQENLAEGVAPGAVPSMVPAANQPKALEKPGRPVVLCPPGSLGCS